MTDTPTPELFHRLVAIGDSFTEGVGDEDPQAPGGVRGWADRVAEVLSRQHPAFEYANLAVRGKLIQPIVREQVDRAIAMRPDLITFCAGGNDILRPGSDPDRVAAVFDRALARLTATGATVVIFTGPDLRTMPAFALIRGKVAIYNENMRASAERRGALVVDQWGLRALHDASRWSQDRLHLSPVGHHLMAIRVLETLGLDHDLSPEHVAGPPVGRWHVTQEDVHWARQFLWPWVMRRMTGRSSADGRHAKLDHPVHPSPS
ncbi:SGNH/GDSL hydrolase family protein [Pseudoclavibacter sp. 13-3]|uniref:SGNH/GDSL hydrolase family protein n=1 Tax=Pseudoclavibacter sp. 13-3 TaxID=2901228 RepID=UPI001E3CF841|nr:SGNH/GDSL hydrolase family protein [Pseudoclavibacter sp. 13-3]MCD7100651.1 SGNH/GDSL hydrolase family protein [Pseudoclavibacter sp. 13-3]